MHLTSPGTLSGPGQSWFNAGTLEGFWRGELSPSGFGIVILSTQSFETPTCGESVLRVKIAQRKTKPRDRPDGEPRAGAQTQVQRAWVKLLDPARPEARTLLIASSAI